MNDGVTEQLCLVFRILHKRRGPVFDVFQPFGNASVSATEEDGKSKWTEFRFLFLAVGFQ
jgi:hypothetical protein